MERSRETEQNDLGQAVMRLQVDGVEHPSVASYARGLQKEAWLMVAAGAVVANSTRHWMANSTRRRRRGCSREAADGGSADHSGSGGAGDSDEGSRSLGE